MAMEKVMRRTVYRSYCSYSFNEEELQIIQDETVKVVKSLMGLY
jgi:hypothetical protein